MKRAIDLLGAGMALILLSPVMGLVYLLVVLKLGKPALFRQKRPGLKGEIFEMYKFRSMTDERDAEGNLLPDDKRLPPFGQKLRSTSLDELPALINVLKGEMSLVGPRPLLVEYLPLYSSKHAHRHDVRPGLTGWAQVKGRNAVTWKERLDMDIWYVENRNFALDMKILWLTVSTVLQRKGVSSEGHVTMPRFRGLDNEEETS